MAQRCRYTGSPLHKRDPDDYGPTPPGSPRPGNALCDTAGPIPLTRAQKLLKEGFSNGMVSVQFAGEWPQLVWSITENGEVL